MKNFYNSELDYDDSNYDYLNPVKTEIKHINLDSLIAELASDVLSKNDLEKLNISGYNIPTKEVVELPDLDSLIDLNGPLAGSNDLCSDEALMADLALDPLGELPPTISPPAPMYHPLLNNTTIIVGSETTSNQPNYLTLTLEELLVGNTAEILLPAGFTTIIKSIMEKDGYEFTTKRKKVNTRTLQEYERTLILCSALYSRYITTHYHYTPAHYRPLLNNTTIIVGSETTSNGTSFLEYVFELSRTWFTSRLLLNSEKLATQYIELLKKYELIVQVSDEVSYIDYTDPNAPKETKARSYQLSMQFTHKTTKYTIQTKQLVDSLSKLRHSWAKNNETNNEFKKLLNDIPKHYEFPTLEYVNQIADSMVKSQELDKHGRMYVWEYDESDYSNATKTIKLKDKKINLAVKKKVNLSVVSIKAGIYIYEKFLNEGLYFKDSSVQNGFKTRYYTSFSLMPTWIRKLIRINGQELIENDYTALHNRFINKLCGNICQELTGDSHTKLQNVLGLKTREEAKRVGLSYWNSKIDKDKNTISSFANKELFAKMDKFLQTNYLPIWLKLISIKSNTHKNMSKILFEMERNLMDTIVNKYCKNECYIYAYDCLYLTKSIKSEMEKELP